MQQSLEQLLFQEPVYCYSEEMLFLTNCSMAFSCCFHGRFLSDIYITSSICCVRMAGVVVKSQSLTSPWTSTGKGHLRAKGRRQKWSHPNPIAMREGTCCFKETLIVTRSDIQVLQEAYTGQCFEEPPPPHDVLTPRAICKALKRIVCKCPGSKKHFF